MGSRIKISAYRKVHPEIFNFTQQLKAASFVAMKLRFICLILFVVGIESFAYFETNKSYDGKKEMNGIVFKKYQDFMHKWPLVTTRFRQDSKELRLTYANPIAWKHMVSQSKKPYPEGSVFGKVAFNTEKDPDFVSSEIPSKARRYQLMIKDSKKFKETGGWGYALFDDKGVTFNEEPTTKTMACYACHTIVKNKDYVFSVRMPLGLGEKPMDHSFVASGIQWIEKDFSQLADSVKKLIPEQKGKIFYMQSEMNKNFFSGTLDEIVPTLIAKSKETKAPTLFFGDQDNFSLIVPGANNCRQLYVYFKAKPERQERSCD